LEVRTLEIKWEQNQHRTSKLILLFDDLGGLEDRGGQGAEVADKARGGRACRVRDVKEKQELTVLRVLLGCCFCLVL
jgi:hypothetical protein